MNNLQKVPATISCATFQNRQEADDLEISFWQGLDNGQPTLTPAVTAHMREGSTTLLYQGGELVGFSSVTRTHSPENWFVLLCVDLRKARA
jgi:hypothetical protein